MTHLTAASPDEDVLARAAEMFADDPEPCTYFDRVWGECPNDAPCPDHGEPDGRWRS